MKASITCLVVLVAAMSADAQWEYGGRNIGYGDAYLSPKIAPDGNGGFFIVWDGFHAGRTTKDIILNHVDTAGVLLFGADGLSITDDTLNQDEPRISADGEGGCYIVWHDTRDFSGGRASLYGQRVAADGQLLWGSGVRMIYTVGNLHHGTGICADSALGIIGVCIMDTGTYHCWVFGQKLTPDGEIAWDSGGVVLFAAPDTTRYFNIFNPKITASDRWLYVTLIFSNAEVGDIYIQKFDLDGMVLWGPWGRPVSTDRREDGSWDEAASLQILPDGAGGTVVGWVATDPDLGTTLYADRISPQGNSMWQVNGKRLYPNEISNRFGLGLFCFDSFYSTYVAVGLGGAQGKYQVVFSDGSLLAPDGMVLSEHSLKAAVAYLDTMYLMYADGWHYFASKKDIRAIEYWPTNPWIHGFLEYWDLLPDGVGGLYVAYSYYRDFLTNWVGIQRIYPDGHFGGDTTGVGDDETPILPGGSFELTNYPNPFNSETIVRFQANAKDDIKAEIFNLLGQKVAEFSVPVEKGGVNSLRLSLNQFPSGTYFLRVATDEGFSDVIAVTLLK